PDKFVIHRVIAQDVTDVLAQKTFDAFPEFLHTIDVFVLHTPCAVRRIRRSRLERFDLFLHSKIPRDIRYQILDHWEGFQRFDRNRFFQGQITQPRHAHELRQSVHFRGARPTLARLAIPSTRKIRHLRLLDVVHGIEHDHPFGELRRVITELTAVGVAAPDSEGGRTHKASDLSGERTRSACWLWRSAATNFPRRFGRVLSNHSKEKSANVWRRSPARRRRALPNPAVPGVRLISSLQ